MLSVANVRTAGGAARYFAADNYYTRADADRSGEWFGKGADKLVLSGEVDAKTFEAILKGFLPDGTRLGTDKREHRAGTDLTFSMPKSWSLLALVGGDQRNLVSAREPDLRSGIRVQPTERRGEARESVSTPRVGRFICESSRVISAWCRRSSSLSPPRWPRTRPWELARTRLLADVSARRWGKPLSS